MRARISIIGFGLLILILGIIFFLQGNSVVGPSSSFMYSNPKWITYGQEIMVVGVIVTVTGIWLSLRRPR